MIFPWPAVVTGVLIFSNAALADPASNTPCTSPLNGAGVEVRDVRYNFVPGSAGPLISVCIVSNSPTGISNVQVRLALLDNGGRQLAAPDMTNINNAALCEKSCNPRVIIPFTANAQLDPAFKPMIARKALVQVNWTDAGQTNSRAFEAIVSDAPPPPKSKRRRK